MVHAKQIFYTMKKKMKMGFCHTIPNNTTMTKHIVTTLLAMSTLVLAGDFGCSEQKDCLTVTTQFDSCTKKYTVCLSWVNCIPKPEGTISHVCSTALGTGACNAPTWGDLCLGKQESWPANTPICVEGEPNGFVNFGVKDSAGCANSDTIGSYNVVGGYPGFCVADTSTSGSPADRSHFLDCVGGNDQECLWVFPVPPCPTEYPPCTTTTTSTSTTTTPCVTETKYVTVTNTETETVNQPTTTTLTQGTTTTQSTTIIQPITNTVTVIQPTTTTITQPITDTITLPTTVLQPTTTTITQPITNTVTVLTTVVQPTTITVPTIQPTTTTKTQTVTKTFTPPPPAVTSTARPPLCGKVYCGPNADCLPKCKSGPVCRCKAGYWGPNCAKYDRNLYPICRSLSCNYGNCIANGRSCKCSCFKGHYGTRCV